MAKSICICGTGSYVPERIVTNVELEETSPTNRNWIQEKLGIMSRRRVAEGEATSDMAVAAGRKAIETAGLKSEDIELIILGTITPDRLIPSAATIIQRKLGAVNAVAFDLNAACAGFVYGLITGAQFLETGHFKNALIIGADTMSMITDYEDRTCAYYGDAAGAVVIRLIESENGIKSMYFASDGRSVDSVTVKGVGSEHPLSEEVLNNRWQYLYMGGKDVYNKAREIIPMSIRKALKMANLTIDDISYVIPHQPNLTLLKECAVDVGLHLEKVAIVLDRFANSSSGNIPLAMDLLNQEGKLKDGDNILLVTIGAGWTWGSVVLKWKG
ncbi:3-oxoacyl-[acyl-carrier-protein] synthase-3 [Anaerovirgula multivorans]|uniref:3-oxoacyl-[acyl-carrier-protein] synthase-3 n=1 Tax=Anaerovirgula multivorans TaxID=312168 RepID=A0A239J7B4_9FIRM|nr:beta-ketoacyl-ACP synthase III [Anaerovirgula multivorans]SNT01133.1 3-oxoacyl-[acyl-carrier-protein] synthase-3 [Anaerovirgula multivorans]